MAVSSRPPIEVSVYDEKTGSSELKTITRAELIGRKKRVNGVHAFHLNDDGVPVIMRPSEWEAIYRDVSVLEPVLRKTEERNGVPDSMEAAWRLEATRVLPPGVFLYRDDFELLFQKHIGSFTSITDYDPPDFRIINYSAYIRPEYKTLVWEGFGHLRQACEALQTGLVTAQKAAEVKTFYTQAEAAKKLRYAAAKGIDLVPDEALVQIVSPLSDKLLFKAQPNICHIVEEFEIPIVECTHTAQQSSADTRSHIDAYLEQHKKTPVREKVLWLRETANMNNQGIGDILNIGTDHPGCKSRKTTVQALYRSNFDDETWKRMHPEKKKKK